MVVSSYPLYSGVIGSGQRWSSSLSRPPTKKEHKDRQACVYVCMREKNPCEPVRTGANRCEPVRIKYRTRAMLQCSTRQKYLQKQAIFHSYVRFLEEIPKAANGGKTWVSYAEITHHRTCTCKLLSYPILGLGEPMHTIHNPFLTQWEFQDPKMEVLYHIRPYLVGIFPYIGLKNRPCIW